MAGGGPVNTVRWIIRLRALLDRGYSRVDRLETALAVAEAELASRSHRVDRLETDLRDRSIRLAAAEAQLASRSYRLALWIRSLANGLRKIARWLHLR